MKNIIILGAGGFSREVAWLIEEINEVQLEWNIVGYIDDNVEKHGEVLNGHPVVGDYSWFATQQCDDLYTVCAVGDPKVKEKLIKKAMQYHLKFANLIHPTVRISKYNELGTGNIVCAGNIITTNVTIGNHVIVNLDCTIGHDAIIEDYVTLLPSTNISGNTLLKKGCNIGTQSVVLPSRTVGEWAVLGAGAIVTNDIPPSCVAVGMPAKPIKFFEKEELG